MIISASRRTDIPAFYAQWFMNRLRTGFVEVRNPYNARQVRRVSLRPEDMSALVFWTRNPKPIRPHLMEIAGTGVPYYFMFTIMGYDRSIESSTPSLPQALDEFAKLSQTVGPERLIWRYDPILFSRITPPQWHMEQFDSISHALRGLSQRVVISFADHYGRVQKNLTKINGLEARECHEQQHDLFKWLRALSEQRGFQIQTCAEDPGSTAGAIPAGKCIDDQWLAQISGNTFSPAKDRNQRDACLCIPSVDIGSYDTCLHGCTYCYATTRPAFALRNHQNHNPLSASMA